LQMCVFDCCRITGVRGRLFTACVSLVEETGAVTTTSTTVAAACVVVRTRLIRRASLSHSNPVHCSVDSCQFTQSCDSADWETASLFSAVFGRRLRSL